MSKKVGLFLGLFASTLVGIVVGAYAQSSTAAKLAKLSEEKAEISKMDMVLLNTRVSVLQQMLKEDLLLTFAPTTVVYNGDEKKIVISVQVDPTFIAKTSPSQLSKAFEARATSLCVAPSLADGNFVYLFPIQPPKDYCVIGFITYGLGSGGRIERKEVAIFEDGKLTMK